MLLQLGVGIYWYFYETVKHLWIFKTRTQIVTCVIVPLVYEPGAWTVSIFIDILANFVAFKTL